MRYEVSSSQLFPQFIEIIQLYMNKQQHTNSMSHLERDAEKEKLEKLRNFGCFIWNCCIINLLFTRVCKQMTWTC